MPMVLLLDLLSSARHKDLPQATQHPAQHQQPQQAPLLLVAGCLPCWNSTAKQQEQHRQGMPPSSAAAATRPPQHSCHCPTAQQQGSQVQYPCSTHQLGGGACLATHKPCKQQQQQQQQQLEVICCPHMARATCCRLACPHMDPTWAPLAHTQPGHPQQQAQQQQGLGPRDPCT
jgi:hypothetical protein